MEIRHAHAAKTQPGGDGADGAKHTGYHEGPHPFRSPRERDDRPGWRAPLDKIINDKDAAFEGSAQRPSLCVGIGVRAILGSWGAEDR